ncbi:MAG: hypothetical protein AAF517_15710 [Planctomycetota bacterium]
MFGLSVLSLVLAGFVVVSKWGELQTWFRTREIAGEWYLYHVSVDAPPINRGIRLSPVPDKFLHPVLRDEMTLTRSGRLKCGSDPLRSVEVGVDTITVPSPGKEAASSFTFHLNNEGEWVLENDEYRARYRRGRRPEGAPPPHVEYRRVLIEHTTF